jgi:hypothetical protein
MENPKTLDKALDNLKREIDETIRQIEQMPSMVEQSVRETVETVVSAPLVAAAEHLKNFRIFMRESLKIPKYVVEDARDVPILVARFALKSPSEAREDIREYLTWKKKVRPLNVIDLLVDILDTIIPG